MPNKHDNLAVWLERIERMHPRGEAGVELGLDRVAVVAAEDQQDIADHHPHIAAHPAHTLDQRRAIERAHGITGETK